MTAFHQTNRECSPVKHDAVISLWYSSVFLRAAEGGADGSSGAPSCSDTVHPGDGSKLAAGPSGLLQTVFPQSQSRTHTHLLTLDFSFEQCDAHSGRVDVVDGNSFLSVINLFRFPLEDGQDVYLEVFYTELEAFKRRLGEHTVRCNGKPEPKEAWTSSALPPVGPLLSARTRRRFYSSPPQDGSVRLVCGNKCLFCGLICMNRFAPISS